MKNKNIIIAAAALMLLLLLGIAGFLMLNKNSSVPKTIDNKTSQTTSDEQTTKSLLDLVNMGQNLRCTFNTELEGGLSEGTVYISGTNMRGDFNIAAQDGNKMQTSMIRKGDTSYIWGSSMENKGIKMTLALDKISENKQASQYVDPNQKVNYKCSPWSVDSSLFTPPSNIEFTDMSQFMMPKTSGTQTESAPSSVNPCSQISDDTARAACESALDQSGQ